MEMFNNRRLTGVEEKFRADKRCIACGVKVDVTPIYKKINGKRVKTGERWPFECKDCSRTRLHVTNPVDGVHYGQGQHSMHHEFLRRIGGAQRGGD